MTQQPQPPPSTTDMNSPPTSFPRFPRLPPELRNQIWLDSLPTTSRPALFPYQTQHWRIRPLGPSDPRYAGISEDAENLANNFVYEYRHDLLPPLQLNVGMANVNREARSIALAWAKRELNIIIRITAAASSSSSAGGDDERGGRLLFHRVFDIARDAVYVAPRQWGQFIEDALGQGQQPGTMVEWRPALAGGRLAIPSEFLDSPVHGVLSEYFGSYAVETLYLVYDMDSGRDEDWWQGEGKDVRQDLWELDDGPTGTVYVARWDHDVRGFVHEATGRRAVDTVCKPLVDVAAQALLEKLRRYMPIRRAGGRRSLEIRVVSARKM